MGGSKDILKEICKTYQEFAPKHKILIISSANKDGLSQKDAY
jgi:hypothetical protein